MCLAVFIFDSLEKYSLVLAFNRDEDLKRRVFLFPSILLCFVVYVNAEARWMVRRESHPTHWWDTHVDSVTEPCKILGGRDKVSGGTWLCAGENGRVAFVTNVRNRRSLQVNPNSPSRGYLPLICVTDPGENELEKCLASLNKEAYSPFNLVAAELSGSNGSGKPRMWYLSNENEQEWMDLARNSCNHAGITDVKSGMVCVQPGIHALSNKSLNSPWPKVVLAKKCFQEMVESGDFDKEDGSFPWDEIFLVMQNSSILESRSDALEDTGYGYEWESRASGIFVKPTQLRGAIWATRSITVLAVRRDGHAELRERYLASSDPDKSNDWEEEQFIFKMNL